MARLFRGALGLARTDSPKFDALVGFGSRAHKQIITTAHQVVETYIDNVDLKQRRPNPYTVGSVLVRMEELESFNNALHDGYSGLNSLEVTFARSLDRTGLPRTRPATPSGDSSRTELCAPQSWTRPTKPLSVRCPSASGSWVPEVSGWEARDSLGTRFLVIAPAAQALRQALALDLLICGTGTGGE